MLFRKLERAQLREIVGCCWAPHRGGSLLESDFRVTDAAIDRLAEVGYEPEYGARPLRRVIQREVDDRIADLFVSGELADGGAVDGGCHRRGFVVMPVVPRLAA